MLKNLMAELGYRRHQPKRVLFDHLPKCAGSTINQFLTSHYPQRLTYRLNTSNNSYQQFISFDKDKRYKYHLVIGHLNHELLNYVHPETVTLTVFRDPIDRIVSHYFYVRRSKSHYLHEAVMKSNMELQDYAVSNLSPELRNWYTTHFTGLSIEEAEREPEAAIQKAIQVILQRYKIIGFQDDLLEVSRKLEETAGLWKQFENHLINKTNKRLTLKEISGETKNMIAEVNFLDVKLYKILREHFEN
ncbi:sulfotransferase family 2 domain-containing protein [Anthocerotibacter panamensis]|uniref:sulfotransferase family 2 domain-containing protein n=1 Tax=Anthocerotibacter panamensis TaxID=2857077 RepID=UPI001C404B6A|nr:sulfotransferase family 2 domain-containing protein [Anthocerotibacter panamensis]